MIIPNKDRWLIASPIHRLQEIEELTLQPSRTQLPDGAAWVPVDALDPVTGPLVHDHGKIVDAARQRALKSGSLGLISMEERALLAGGRLKMRTVPHAGTTVQATFTLDNTDVEKT